jgi:hypothetical protein
MQRVRGQDGGPNAGCLGGLIKATIALRAAGSDRCGVARARPISTPQVRP